MPPSIINVAWISSFPVEWLSDVPPEVQRLPREHPATWQQVLLGQFERNPSIRLHVLAVRSKFERSLTFERRGVRFHLLKTPAGTRAPSLFWVDTWLIRRVLRRIEPDLVHAWGTESGAALIASRLAYPRLVTMHGISSWLIKVLPLNRYQRFMACFEDRSLRRAAHVTAESSFAVDYLRHRFPHLQVIQVEHAPFGLFHAVPRRPQLKPSRLLFVGDFREAKGADVLCRALDRLRGEIAFELVVVGTRDEMLRNRLEPPVSPELWQRIQFRSYQPSEEVAREMASATLLVHPTRADNSPNAVKEAVVAGLPVVASRVGGIPDHISEGRNGLLFETGSVEGLEAALRAALAHPVLGAGQVDAAALAAVRSRLSPEFMAQAFLDVYRRILSGKTGRS
jgi:glycosyltransferase involved in cell wall biosynthesis